MIFFRANGRKARAHTSEVLTSGSVGIPVTVRLNRDFDGLMPTLVFRCEHAAADVPLLGDDVTVPPQVLLPESKMLKMGVYASDSGGNVVIPTIWADVGVVVKGTRPSGVRPVGPEPSWASQLQERVVALSNMLDSVCSSIAQTEGETASRRYVEGELVMVDGSLYVITSDVDVGEEFNVGVNMSATTVSDELAKLG